MSGGGIWRRTRQCISTILILTMAGCQVMDSSISYDIRPDGSQARRCNSGLGSYSLPFSTIKVKVVQDYKDTNPIGRPRLAVFGPEPHPDPKHLYCLDFLENAFSDDLVTVAYSGQGDTSNLPSSPAATGMLSLIASKNVDQTGEVIRNLIRAIFVLASRNPQFSLGRQAPADGVVTVIMTEQSVNPFDLAAMSALNRSLHEYGYCLTLGKYTYDVDRLKPDAYCENPDISRQAGAGPPFLEAASSQKYLVEKLPTGIFYRPRQPYSLFVHVRDDPDIGGPWELRKIDTVMLENISPILVLRVNRTIFAEYRTALAFDNGNLLDVCIGKGSEVAGGLEIPLDIIYGLVSLPGEVIVQEIERKRHTIEFLEKQRELIDLQNTILAAKANTFPGADKNVDGALLGADLKYAHFTAGANEPAAIGTTAQGADFNTICSLLKT